MADTQRWRVVIDVDGHQIKDETIVIPDSAFPYFSLDANHLGGYSQNATMPSEIHIEAARLK